MQVPAATPAELSAGIRRSRSLGDSSPLGSPPLWTSRSAWASPASDGATPAATHRWPSSSTAGAAGFGIASPLSASRNSSSSLAAEGLKWALARRSCSSSSRRRPCTGSDAYQEGVGSGGVLGAVQRQIEALEERLAQQIARAQRTGNSQVDTGLRQLEARMSASEGVQPKLGRRLAELSGQLKGVVEEVQSQVLRFDSLDAKLGNCRRELDDELQQKITKLEKQLESSAAEVWRTGSLDAKFGDCRPGLDEDLQRRLMKLEQQLEASAEVFSVGSLDAKLGDWRRELQEELKERLSELQRQMETSGPEESTPPRDVADREIKAAPSACSCEWQQASQRLHSLCEEISRSELQLQEQGIRLEQQECSSKSLNGHVKGLLEDMQSQVLRTDALDARLSVCRREFVEEVQQKLLTLQQQLNSETPPAKEPAASALPAPQSAASCTEDAGLYAAVTDNGWDRRFIEATKQLERLQEDVANSEVQLQDQGLRLEAALSRLEAQEICYRKSSSERLDWDARLEQMNQALRDEDHRSAERVTSLSHRVDGLEQELVKFGASFSDFPKIIHKVDDQERELANLGTHVGDLHERSQASAGHLVILRERMDSSVIQMEELSERLQSLAAQKPTRPAKGKLSSMLKADSAVAPAATATAGAADATAEDGVAPCAAEELARQQESVAELQDVLEEMLPKVAEHDRSTRVLLCDVMPRLGELSDARDEVRRNILAISERLAGTEAELRYLQPGAPGRLGLTTHGAPARQVCYAVPGVVGISPPARRLDLEKAA